MSLPQTSYCLTLTRRHKNSEYCFIRNEDDLQLVTFQCPRDIQAYAQRILAVSKLSLTLEEVNLAALLETCRQRGITVSFVPQGSSHNVPLPEDLVPSAEYVGLVYSLVAKESLNLLIDQIENKFGIVLAGKDSGKAQLVSMLCGICIDLAIQQDKPVARRVVKSIVRDVTAMMTDDILNWCVNRLIAQHQDGLASTLANAGTKVFLKMFRAIALEMYIDQTIDQLNMRYGWNL